MVVTLLQLFTSSFAAYAFAKMQFKGKNALFLGYIATIAVPWQAYMVPQFMMMSAWHLNNTCLLYTSHQRKHAEAKEVWRNEGIRDQRIAGRFFKHFTGLSLIHI